MQDNLGQSRQIKSISSIQRFCQHSKYTQVIMFILSSQLDAGYCDMCDENAALHDYSWKSHSLSVLAWPWNVATATSTAYSLYMSTLISQSVICCLKVYWAHISRARNPVSTIVIHDIVVEVIGAKKVKSQETGALGRKRLPQDTRYVINQFQGFLT